MSIPDIVTVANLSKRYGDFTAVNNISFSIGRGEIFGFLGPNGAGKTTTINMMIGLARPSGGSILIDGIDVVKNVKKAHAIMGIVPDESNLYDEMNGFDNLCFCGSLYGMGRLAREKRAEELLEQFDLTKAGNRSFKAYSGLMAMSVLFGTTSMLAVTITFERKGHSFDRLLLAPVSLGTMVAAKLSGAILFGLLNAFVPVLFTAFFVDLAGINWGVALLAVFLIAVTSTLLGLMIAVSANEVFEAQTFSNFFRFPMLFLCGLFLPIGSLPVFLRPLSYLLPLTYGTDLLKGAVLDINMLPPVLSIVILLVFSITLFTFCQYGIRRKWIL